MKIRNLVVRFGERVALDIDDLEFDDGVSYAVIGHNGCGKSTLARCISGVLQPSAGKIEFAPGDSVRYMPQHSFAFYGTARKNILLGARTTSVGSNPGGLDDGARADMYIEELALDKVKDSKAKSLSGGETARMALARTLMGDANWVVLDEPTSAFDGESTLAAERLVNWYRGEHDAGVILITHSLKQAMRASERIVFMEGGHVIEQGETASCLKNPQTQALSKFLEIFGS